MCEALGWLLNALHFHFQIKGISFIDVKRPNSYIELYAKKENARSRK